MIVTASFGIEPGRRVEYVPLVEKALELSTHRPSRVLIYNRPNMVGAPNAAELSLPLISFLFTPLSCSRSSGAKKKDRRVWTCDVLSVCLCL